MHALIPPLNFFFFVCVLKSLNHFQVFRTCFVGAAGQYPKPALVPETQISCNPHSSWDSTEFSPFQARRMKGKWSFAQPLPACKRGLYNPNMASVLISALLIANQSRSDLFSTLLDTSTQSWRINSPLFSSTHNSIIPNRENVGNTVASIWCNHAQFIWKWIMDRWLQLLETDLDLFPAFKIIGNKSSALVLPPTYTYAKDSEHSQKSLFL